MESVIVFGASRGGENFIENNIKNYQILAVADNDVEKHGRLLGGIPVIAPDEIKKYNYDHVIIASMYVHSITEQLVGLGIKEDKIKYAAKNAMKTIAYPFQNPKILERANEMIKILSTILHEVTHFYTFGTLLGIVREGELIPWDDDIDLAIFGKDALEVKNVLLEHADEISDILQSKIYVRKYEDDRVASITLDCYFENNLVFNVNYDCMYVEQDMVIQEQHKTPLRYFEKHEKVDFNGHLINVPYNYEAYLTHTYGDWRVVKKHTSFYNNALSFYEPNHHCTSELIYDGLNR